MGQEEPFLCVASPGRPAGDRLIVALGPRAAPAALAAPGQLFVPQQLPDMPRVIPHPGLGLDDRRHSDPTSTDRCRIHMRPTRGPARNARHQPDATACLAPARASPPGPPRRLQRAGPPPCATRLPVGIPPAHRLTRHPQLSGAPHTSALRAALLREHPRRTRLRRRSILKIPPAGRRTQPPPTTPRTPRTPRNNSTPRASQILSPY